MSVNVAFLVHPAQKGDEEAFLGQVVFEPIAEDDVLSVLSALGAAGERLFPEHFQYAQVVSVHSETGPHGLGVMMILAPFPDEPAARDFMRNASAIVRGEIGMALMATHGAPATAH